MLENNVFFKTIFQRRKIYTFNMEEPGQHTDRQIVHQTSYLSFGSQRKIQTTQNGNKSTRNSETKPSLMKSPFSDICKLIYETLMDVQKKIKSKAQFYHQFSKMLINKSHHLQDIYLIPELQEINTDPRYIDKSIGNILQGIEFRNSPLAQQNMINLLMMELNSLQKEIFDLLLLKDKQEIKQLCQKITYERDEVQQITKQLSFKHFPNFSEKVNISSIFSHNTMPVTFRKEKFENKEEKLGEFKFVSMENRFICSQIEKAICKLKGISIADINPLKPLVL